MTVDELRKALGEFPGYYPVTIAQPDMESFDEDESFVPVGQLQVEGFHNVQVVLR